MSPLFEADRARVDVHGAPAVDELTLATSGDHVLVVGAARALFEAASGMRSTSRGSVRVGGENPVIAVRGGRVAGALLDAPLPPKWTPREYATWSARLVGHGAREASSLAGEAIERLKMTSVADAPIVRAPPIVRRATAIAAAIATGAEIIVLDDPLAGLADDQARSLARIIARALDDRRWLVFAPRVPLTSPLAMNADDALVISGSETIAQGAPAEIAARERAYSLRMHGESSTFARRVMERGGRVAGTAAQLTVDLGDLTTGDLMRIANESNAVILELYPLGARFA